MPELPEVETPHPDKSLAIGKIERCSLEKIVEIWIALRFHKHLCIGRHNVRGALGRSQHRHNTLHRLAPRDDVDGNAEDNDSIGHQRRLPYPPELPCPTIPSCVASSPSSASCFSALVRPHRRGRCSVAAHRRHCRPCHRRSILVP